MKLDLGTVFTKILLLSLVCLALGCRNDEVSQQFRDMNKLNMQKLCNSYVMFASVNKSIGPQNAEELKNFIKTDERVPPRLGMSSADLGNLDDLFISGADGEPFQIRYGLKIRVDEDRSPLVFDKTGVDGMRRVGLADNEIMEVTDSKKYDRMWEGKSSKTDTAIDESMMDVEEVE